MAALLPAACTDASAVSRAAMPEMHWDHVPQAQDWTQATMAAVMGHGQPLLSTVPADIESFCPGYTAASEQDRAAFWAGLISALAKFESTWNESASGGGGRWIGLLQIDPRTARGYGCSADEAGELKDGEANLACGVRIMASTVPRDNAIATRDSRWRGIAADWAPLQKAEARGYIADWTRSQDYCTAG
ncbi:MAG: transglycosylase SLT domain-containing protein [Rhodobacteraceae bacterium]|nr:transglycosylase SLT domain-containing protein [Paracoccaceae bacterium]